MYFTEINISGIWARQHKAADLHWVAKAAKPGSRATWMSFHKEIKVKIAYAHTLDNTRYLNILVKGLSKVKAPVGGLLREDDHSVAATPSQGCKRRITL